MSDLFSPALRADPCATRYYIRAHETVPKKITPGL